MKSRYVLILFTSTRAGHRHRGELAWWTAKLMNRRGDRVFAACSWRVTGTKLVIETRRAVRRVLGNIKRYISHLSWKTSIETQVFYLYYTHSHAFIPCLLLLSVLSLQLTFPEPDPMWSEDLLRLLRPLLIRQIRSRHGRQTVLLLPLLPDPTPPLRNCNNFACQPMCKLCFSRSHTRLLLRRV